MTSVKYFFMWDNILIFYWVVGSVTAPIVKRFHGQIRPKNVPPSLDILSKILDICKKIQKKYKDF